MGEETITKKSTTIAIDVETSNAIDIYCATHKILKKDFVKIAVKQLSENDTVAKDAARRAQEEQIDVSKEIKRVIDRVSNLFEHKDLRDADKYRNILNEFAIVKANIAEYSFKEQRKNSSTDDSKILSEIQELTKLYKDSLDFSKKHLDRLSNDLIEERGKREQTIADLNKAKDELRRCRGFFSRADEQVLEELGIL